MTLLAVQGLCKSFGGVTAVNAVDLAIEQGAIFGIIGPNGAGKTTLFNLLTGFIKADRGRVLLRGTDVLGSKPHRLVELGMARSFQLVKPFFGMTALETVLLPRWGSRIRSRGSTTSEMRAAGRQRLEELGLAHKAETLVDDLNQSELRLLDIARTLATEPDILFLDEPFSGLGHSYVAELSTLLRRLRERGATIVLIEHRLRELMRLVDRAMVINFGSKLAEGSPAEVVQTPAVVEAYLGSRGTALGLVCD